MEAPVKQVSRPVSSNYSIPSFRPDSPLYKVYLKASFLPWHYVIRTAATPTLNRVAVGPRKGPMRIREVTSLLVTGICAAGCVALYATIPPAGDLELINRLDTVVQLRFADPAPLSLGMSRVARPVSMGTHFYPKRVSARDFQPQTPVEKAVIDSLEERHTQVGFYVFGSAIAGSEASALNYRALKGPAAMTRGTPRPAWYPSSSNPATVDPNALPDWKAIYPLASKSMRSFQDGGQGFETTVGDWNIAVRPVVASQQKCVTCHNSTAFGWQHTIKLNDPIGGVIYAYRRPIG